MKNFFYLQRSDRRAVTAALTVLAVAVGVTMYVGHADDATPADGADTTHTRAYYDNSETGKKPNTAYYDTGKRKAELFAFDPNTADSTQLLRLGLTPWQVRNIYKYRAAGGIYRAIHPHIRRLPSGSRALPCRTTNSQRKRHAEISRKDQAGRTHSPEHRRHHRT